MRYFIIIGLLLIIVIICFLNLPAKRTRIVSTDYKAMERLFGVKIAHAVTIEKVYYRKGGGQDPGMLLYKVSLPYAKYLESLTTPRCAKVVNRHEIVEFAELDADVHVYFESDISNLEKAYTIETEIFPPMDHGDVPKYITSYAVVDKGTLPTISVYIKSSRYLILYGIIEKTK